MVMAGLVCGIVPWAPAHAQKKGDDAAALNAELETLYRTGKYAERVEIAKRFFKAALISSTRPWLRELPQAAGRHFQSCSSAASAWQRPPRLKCVSSTKTPHASTTGAHPVVLGLFPQNQNQHLCIAKQPPMAWAFGKPK